MANGKRGRAKKPERLLKLHVAAPPTATPTPADDRPARPDFGHDERAAEFWDTYAPQLIEVGRLRKVDAPGFELMARAWSRLQAWQEKQPFCRTGIEQLADAIREHAGIVQLFGTAEDREQIVVSHLRTCDLLDGMILGAMSNWESWVKGHERLSAEFWNHASRFGMSPRDRVALKDDKAVAENPFTAFARSRQKLAT